MRAPWDPWGATAIELEETPVPSDRRPETTKPRAFSPERVQQLAARRAHARLVALVRRPRPKGVGHVRITAADAETARRLVAWLSGDRPSAALGEGARQEFARVAGRLLRSWEQRQRQR